MKRIVEFVLRDPGRRAFIRGVVQRSTFLERIGRRMIVGSAAGPASPQETAPSEEIVAIAPATMSGSLAKKVLGSGYFDPSFYARSTGIEFSSDLDAAGHYVELGEREGLNPSRNFDPVFYRECNADLAEYGGSLLLHFVDYGRAEGRTGSSSAAVEFRTGQQQSVESRKTVLIVLHEASITGAPLLGLNIAQHLSKEFNLLVFVMRDGALVPELLKCSLGVLSPVDGSAASMPAKVIEQAYFRFLLNEYRIDGVLANSAETEAAIVAAWNLGLPIVSLVHEFTEYVRPRPVTRMSNILNFSTRVVFSSELTMRSALDFTQSDARHISVIPQGKSVLPKSDSPAAHLAELRKVLGDIDRDAKTLVIGCGWVQPRKGVDLFIAAADKTVQALGKDKVAFLWVGDNYRPDSDFQLSLWLEDQIRRSGLQDNLTIIGALGASDLEDLYRRADIMFLSSRLDPFPNVVIDAIHAGLPVVCFERASGVAEYFSRLAPLRKLVVPYLDVHAAAGVIVELARDASFRGTVSDLFKKLAGSRFEMQTYANELCRLLYEAEETNNKERRSF